MEAAQARAFSLTSSDGQFLSIEAYVESLQDLFSIGAQLVQSLEIRRKSKVWTLQFWSKKTLEGDARSLYDELIEGRVKIQKAFDTATRKCHS
jgi:hypothetical protein